MLYVFIWLSANWWLIPENYHNVIHCINKFISTYDAFCSLLMDLFSYKKYIIKHSNRAFIETSVSGNDWLES